MEIQITKNNIDFAPDSELEEIHQNPRTILTTARGSVPLDRNFGIDMSVIDLPIPLYKAKLTADIYDTISKYEPRVKVVSVKYEHDVLSGRSKPIVKVAIK